MFHDVFSMFFGMLRVLQRAQALRMRGIALTCTTGRNCQRAWGWMMIAMDRPWDARWQRILSKQSQPP